jgi:hypothetical protein
MDKLPRYGLKLNGVTHNKKPSSATETCGPTHLRDSLRKNVGERRNHGPDEVECGSALLELISVYTKC